MMDEIVDRTKFYNLPVVNVSMVHKYFAKKLQCTNAELRNVKTDEEENYGDGCVDYLHLDRDENTGICVVKAEITPEYEAHSTNYLVHASINEKDKIITSCECLICSSSPPGDCEHTVAFILWLHRRSEESLKKLSSATNINKICTLKEMFPTDIPPSKKPKRNYLETFLIEGEKFKSESLISKLYNKNDSMKNTSLHCLSIIFKKSDLYISAENFIQFCTTKMDVQDCEAVEKLTQTNTLRRHEAKFGRITGSKLFEASCCKNNSGILVEKILGSTKLAQETKIKQVKLEDIFKKIEWIKNIRIKKSGLRVNSMYPIFSVSPDGISGKYCIKIKCANERKSYIEENGKLCDKYFAELQLQMFLLEKDYGLFCVVYPNFGKKRNVKIIEVDFDLIYCQKLMKDSSEFWKVAVYPRLMDYTFL